MMVELEKLKDDLMALPRDARAWLAQTLIESLDETKDVDIESLWIKEVNRRSEELEQGKVIGRPATDVLKRAEEKLKCTK